MAATLYAPLLALPHAIAEIVWRGMLIGLFAWGLRCLANLIRTPLTRDPFPLMTIFTLPLTWSAVVNGHSTLAMAGLMMMATAEFAARRWISTAVALGAAVAIQPMALIMVLFSGGVRRPLRVPLATAIAIALTLPLLVQHPAYVISQYFEAVHLIPRLIELGLETRWAQFFSVMHLLDIPIALEWQSIMRAAVAVTILGLLQHATRINRSEKGSIQLYSFSALYLMLFYPLTENNTYCLLAPAIASYVADAYLVQRQPLRMIVPFLMAVGLLGSYEFAKLAAPDLPAIWLAPLMALGLTTLLLPQAFRKPMSREKTKVLPKPLPAKIPSAETLLAPASAVAAYAKETSPSQFNGAANPSPIPQQTEQAQSATTPSRFAA